MGSGRHATRRRRTLPTLLLRAAVVLGLVAGTTAFVASDKQVTLVVDGSSREVTSTAGQVGDLLTAQGLTVDVAHDLVTPLPDEPLEDGDTVVVRFGRPLVLTLDGRTRTMWTTARNVTEALRALGVREQGSFVSASRSARIGRGGMALQVRQARHVTFLADGERHEVTTTAPTLRSALAETGVRLRAQDRVSADLGQQPYPEQVVGVTRVDGRKVVEEKPVRFETVQRRTKDLFRGQRKVARVGKVGIKVRRFVETYLDGELESRRLVETEVVEEPVTQVVLVGTKPAPQNAPTADGLNWAALANCESSGNPDAYNPAGPYYGLYQFLASTWASVGGSGVPTDHSAAEQTYRAQLLYQRSGAGQWPVCGRLLFS